jgi:3-phenylpropionate/trans-cinnamate dioxygenase ferredoxin subunit
MKFVVGALKSELPPGAMKSVEFEGREVLLANVGGTYHAVSRKCTHMGENLCFGTLEGPVVTCPRHGARFDVTTGQAVGKARLLFFATTPKNLATFVVKVEGDQVLVGAD